MSTRLLVVGSSIFEQWQTVAEAAPHARVVNRAVGGTTTAYWVAHLGEILQQERPERVWLYCGSNDLNSDVPEETVIANLQRCVALCLVPLVYFGIIKAPQKAGKWEQIGRINAAFAASLRPQDRFLDTDPVFLPKGQPVARYFTDDGLHLTDDAYAALAQWTWSTLG